MKIIIQISKTRGTLTTQLRTSQVDDLSFLDSKWEVMNNVKGKCYLIRKWEPAKTKNEKHTAQDFATIKTREEEEEP